MITYFFCSKKNNDTKKKLRRENTPYPKQSFIDIDSGTIDQVEIKFENEQEILPGTGVLHIFKKNE